MSYTNGLDDPSAYFQTVLYTGNSANARQVTNDGNSDLQPDFVWIKGRSNQSHNLLYDSSRGVYKQIYSDLTNSEATVTNSLQEFSTDGFKVGTYVYANENTHTFVGWQWKANGGTTTTKSSGTVAGNVTTPCVQQVNTDAGFSIITYTASTSYAGTETHLEHGLGVGPRFLMVRRRDTAADWAVYHAENGASPNAGYGYLVLNTNAATATSSTYWLNTPAESNSTLLSFGNNASVGANGGEYVCYAFAEKQGYSKFGKYVGNGSSDGNGTFVYTGFAPRFVMIKRTDGANDWILHDYKLGTLASTGSEKGNVGNVNSAALRANADSTVDDWGSIDMLSNGFKARSDAASVNANGGTYIYMAFAEHPFTTSTGIPTTAR